MGIEWDMICWPTIHMIFWRVWKCGIPHQIMGALFNWTNRTLIQSYSHGISKLLLLAYFNDRPPFTSEAKSSGHLPTATAVTIFASGFSTLFFRACVAAVSSMLVNHTCDSGCDCSVSQFIYGLVVLNLHLIILNLLITQMSWLSNWAKEDVKSQYLCLAEHLLQESIIVSLRESANLRCHHCN